MRYLNLMLHIILTFLLLMLSACASTATRQFKTAETFEREGKFEDAMYSYADSFKSDPTSSEARIRFFNTRVKAAEAHFKLGTMLAKNGNHGEALREFTAAQGIDPTQARFSQQIEISTRFKNAQLAFQEGSEFEKGNKLKDAHRQYIKAAELFPDNTEYQAALERITKQRKSKLDGYELRLKSSKPITLKFKDAKIKDVFKILTQLSGVNFVFDEGIKDSPVSIFLENASFQQALDLLCNMNKLSTKNLNESTVLLFMNTPDKSKQYEDLVLRTFHLNYMEAKKAINLIRTMIQVRKVYVNEESNSIVVRDTEDVVNVVEKIIDANDMPEAEVVLDVEVIEISDKNAENVGLLLSNYNVQMGVFSPENKLLSTSLSGATATVAAGSTTVTTGGGDITNLVKAFNINNHGAYVTVPNATFNFGKTLAKGEVLSNPKIRVKNKEKSKFNVGTRVPITTTTLNGTVSQVNVQYVDVGVKVNAEPTIQLNNEISIKLGLEVSSILTKEKVGADGLTTVVTIGTRNIETVLSLKDNETSVIGGLIQRSDSSDKTKLYLLSDIPLLGQLFTNTNASKDKTELMLAITPRLVRGVPVPLPGLASFASGKEDHPSLIRPLASFDLEPVFEGDAAQNTVEKKTAPSASTAKKMETVSSPANQPAVKAVPADQIVQPGQPEPVVTPPAPVPIPAPTPTPVPSPSQLPSAVPAQRSLLQIVAPSSVTVGQQFVIDIMVSNVTNLANAPFVLTFDPAVIDFVVMSEGKLLKKDGKQSTFSHMVDPAKGTVAVSLARTAGDQGVSGSGTLVSASFKAKNRGSSRFAIQNQSFTTPQNVPLTVLPFSTAVDVK